MGEAAAALLEAAAFFTPSGISLRPAGFLEDRQPFSLGPFTLTPYLVDHSAFDSYALLVDGGGRRLFYSGDFRAHGRKAALVRRSASTPPKTSMSCCSREPMCAVRTPATSVLDESEVELAMAKTFRIHARPGRGVQLDAEHRSAGHRVPSVKRAGRELVVDLYAATSRGRRVDARSRSQVSRRFACTSPIASGYW